MNPIVAESSLRIVIKRCTPGSPLCTESDALARKLRSIIAAYPATDTEVPKSDVGTAPGRAGPAELSMVRWSAQN